MATYDLASTIPSSVKAGDIINCSYTGAKKEITLPAGEYKLEVWGAQGGTCSSSSTYNYDGGKGGYSKGTIVLNKSTKLFVYTGGQGSNSTSYASSAAGGFNGGGNSGTGGSTTYATSSGGGGGGASDIRIATDSLYARVIVAGGGAGSLKGTYNQNVSVSITNPSGNAYQGGWGGGTIAGGGGSWCAKGGYGGTATGCPQLTSACSNGTYASAGTFGQGANGASCSSYQAGTGAGGGWYGGQGGGSGCGAATGGGGSGYVYTSDTASQYPSGCLLDSSMYLSESSNIGGNTSFTSPTGTAETGHTGNGYCRITVLNAGGSIKSVNINVSGSWIRVA